MPAKHWANTIKKLSCVKRFSQTELAKDENVLEHTAMVALLAQNIGSRLMDETDCCLNMGILLSKALLHDIEESEIGDVSRPVKYSSPNMRIMFQTLESNTALKIFENAADKNSYYIWEDAKGKIEGRIIKYCDALAALLKFHDEIVVRGNRSMMPLMADDIFTNLNSLLSNVIDDNEAYVIIDYGFLNAKLENEICSLK